MKTASWGPGAPRNPDRNGDGGAKAGEPADRLRDASPKKSGRRSIFRLADPQNRLLAVPERERSPPK
jgi:hypothetical protein